MKYFVLAYEGATGTLLSRAAYATAGEAIRARAEAEDKHRGHASVEVVVIRAPSERAIRDTHGRYFAGEPQRKALRRRAHD